MEKVMLEKSQLDDLAGQYYELKQTLTDYRHGMRSKAFKDMSYMQKRQTEMQYKFMAAAINDTITTLLMHNYSDKNLLKDAIRCRFVNGKTKRAILKSIWRTPIYTLL